MAGEQAPLASKELSWRAALKYARETKGSILGLYDKGWPYSYANRILFLMQGYHEPMASRKTWKEKFDRDVIPGTRPGWVLVPQMKYRTVVEAEPEATDEAPVEAEPIEQKRKRVGYLTGFLLVRGVIPLSATTGKELPHVDPPGWSLDQFLAKTGIREVPFEHTDVNVQGYSRGLEFAINPVAANRNRTVFHEIGHIMLGHTIGDRSDEHMHRGLAEGEAETVAYLSLKEVGLLDEETDSHSRGYRQHWMGEEDLPEKSIIRIFRTVEAILRAGRVEAPDATVGAD